ncbi:hypothetical protein X975_26051, partial [Stegodyphus mimosarum]
MNISWQNTPHRLSHYKPHESTIQLGNVTCPVPVHKIAYLEKLNKLRINVFGYEDEEVFPLHVSKR